MRLCNCGADTSPDGRDCDLNCPNRHDEDKRWAQARRREFWFEVSYWATLAILPLSVILGPIIGWWIGKWWSS